MSRTKLPPKYRRHKSSGQAVVTIRGQDVYLGPHGSAGSHELYAKILAGTVTPDQLRRKPSSPVVVETARVYVVELLAAFWTHAHAYYVDLSGEPNGDHHNYRTLVKRLRVFAHGLLVSEFGPMRLIQFQELLIEENLARTTINRRVNMVRRIFQWGVARELVPPAVLDALKAVDPLRFGKTAARETEPVKPVPQAWVEAVLPYCSPHVSAMIQLQMLSGMRSGELVIARTGDINTRGNVWEYRPQFHKTGYRGHTRIVFLGPRAQEILKPWLRINLQEFLFQPREAEAWRLAELQAHRKTPLSCGNKPGSNRRNQPRKKPGDRYNSHGYKQALDYAIAKCNRDRRQRGAAEISWHPHQLRHLAATTLRREFGIETARVVLGHKSVAMTQTYALADQQRAADAMAKVG